MAIEARAHPFGSRQCRPKPAAPHNRFHRSRGRCRGAVVGGGCHETYPPLRPASWQGSRPRHSAPSRRETLHTQCTQENVTTAALRQKLVVSACLSAPDTHRDREAAEAQALERPLPKEDYTQNAAKSMCCYGNLWCLSYCPQLIHFVTGRHRGAGAQKHLRQAARSAPPEGGIYTECSQGHITEARSVKPHLIPFVNGSRTLHSKHRVQQRAGVTTDICGV